MTDENVNQITQERLVRIKKHVCYTKLVYQRVNKKLAVKLSKAEVESLVVMVLDNAGTSVLKKGKNYYVTNHSFRIQLVINSFNCRLITANRVTS